MNTKYKILSGNNILFYYFVSIFLVCVSIDRFGLASTGTTCA